MISFKNIETGQILSLKFDNVPCQCIVEVTSKDHNGDYVYIKTIFSNHCNPCKRIRNCYSRPNNRIILMDNTGIEVEMV